MKVENDKKLHILKAQLKQVMSYYIPPNKKTSSTEPGTSNAVHANWKKTRIEEIRKEIANLKGECQNE